MSGALHTNSSEEELKKRSLRTGFFTRLIKEKPLGTIGAVVVFVLLICGILANFLAPYGYNDAVLQDALEPPSAKYILGTDNLGRDLLSRVIYGARISMIVGLSATSISVVISLMIGLPSGFFGGKFDLIMQRFIDAWMCFPGLILLLTAVAILGPGMWQIIICLGVLGGIGSSRVIRSTVIGVKENMYIDSALAIGASNSTIILQHILPNIAGSVIIIFTTQVAGVILAEASLSFLGFGIPPPFPSWGGMLSGSGRTFMLMAPWMVIWPGLALSIVVYGINMFGDAIRDLLDPRLRGGVGRYGKSKTKKPRAGK